MQQVFGAQLSSALHYEADNFASAVFHNEGAGRFSMAPLPPAAQMAPVRGIVVADADGDGNEDLIIAGNIVDVEANTARADAGNGLVLRGDGRGGFSALFPRQTGFLAPLDASGAAIARDGLGAGRVIVANVGGPVQVFQLNRDRTVANRK